MNQTPLQELDCHSLFLILALAFDRHEIALLTDPSRIQSECTSFEIAIHYAVFANAHRLCRENRKVAERVESRLRFCYGDLVEEVELEAAAQLFGRVSEIVRKGGSRVGGLVWAVASSARTDLDQVRTYLSGLVVLRGLQRLAFDLPLDSAFQRGVVGDSSFLGTTRDQGSTNQEGSGKEK